MSLTEPGPGTESAKNERGILCVRCEHLNYQGQTQCSDCGAELFVACPQCGHQNQRVFTRCQKCRKRLHHNLFAKRRRHHHHRRSAKWKMTLPVLQAVLILAGLAAALALLYIFNHARWFKLR